ncbi:MAG TPA: diaminopimelate decarboxylase [Gemmatimonadales bacterium]|nr:diaminopimelate decarboxylase [Gemmatimonadales bacterium]
MGEGLLTAGRPDGRTGRVGALLADAGLAHSGPSLVLGGVRLTDIAERVGTPTYVYNLGVIRERYRALDAALAPVPHRICFAVKANANLAVLGTLRDLGAGADIVSGGELRRALIAGFPPERIVFSGVGKSDAELDAAVAAGIGHIHVESEAEVAALGAVAARHARRMRVGIRVNPDVSADTHPYIATGRGGIKFGVPFDQVLPLAREIVAHPGLELDTLAMHIGSQLLDPRPYRIGAGRLVELAAAIRGAGIGTLAAIDIGGGLGIRYHDEIPLDPGAVLEAILPLVRGSGLALVLEPGRHLVGPAGVLLTEVLSRKHSGGKDLVIVDAGMNDLVRPSHYSAYHEIVELEASGRPAHPVDVVGPVCETGDFLALDRELPALARGERIAVLGAGAYGFVMSSNYNSRPRAAEVVVDGGEWRIARARETMDDLLRTEER